MLNKKLHKSKLKFYVPVFLIALAGTVFLLATRAQDSTNSFSRFPGDPNPRVTGKAYWGAAVGGNDDPYPRHEQPTGASLSVRRTFFGWWDRTDDMIDFATDDLANNRLPWVSIKPPGGGATNWQGMADGTYDGQIDEMLIAMDNIGDASKPVWFTMHHEPENDGGNPSHWRGMQVKIRQRMNALKSQGRPMDNIAFMPIYMDWTFDPLSGRNPNDWWVDGVWDVIGVDPYCYNSCSSKGKFILDMTGWKNLLTFAEDKNLPIAIGEWGDTNNEDTWSQNMQKFWDFGFDNGKDIIGYAAFDSGLNPPAGDPDVDTTMPPKVLQKFQDILKNDQRVMRINELGSITPNPDPVCEDSSANNTGQPLPCTYDPDPPEDLPITITSPNNGATVSGTVSVTTGPDTDVNELSFRVNGVWQSNDSEAPFSWQWDTTQFPNGEATLTIRARRNGDPGGVYTEKSVQVTINNSSIPPPSKQCDFNNDGTVGIVDLAQLLSTYGTNVTTGTKGDCTNDGKVDLTDLAKLLSLYGQ